MNLNAIYCDHDRRPFDKTYKKHFLEIFELPKFFKIFFSYFKHFLLISKNTKNKTVKITTNNQIIKISVERFYFNYKFCKLCKTK